MRLRGWTGGPVTLATSSDYAVCRGKRGAPEHRLCTCGERRVETTEHAVLEVLCRHDVVVVLDGA